MDCEPEEFQAPVDDSGSDHQTRVESPTHDPTHRVPALGIEPVPELVETLLGKEERGAIVEVRVEFVDHALVSEDAKETGDESEDIDEAEDCDPDQKLLLLGLQLQRFDGETH